VEIDRATFGFINHTIMPRLYIVVLFLLLSHFSTAQSNLSHQVVKGETLYSIARKYHVTVEAVQKANKSIGVDLKLKIGQNLVIPSSGAGVTATKPAKQVPTQVSSSESSTHIVVKGETVYAIAKANGLTPKQIKEANHLPDDMILKLGQKLIIPAKNQEAIYKPAAKEPQTKAITQPIISKTAPQQQENLELRKDNETKADIAPVKVAQPIETPKEENKATSSPIPAKPVSNDLVRNENVAPNDYEAIFAKEADAGKKVTYRGIANFMQSENPGNQFLALYSYAEMGSILKVTNLMSKVSIYVKVIGKMPANDTQSDVILKVSAEAAAKLKVSEDKFLVEVTGYNVP